MRTKTVRILLILTVSIAWNAAAEESFEDPFMKMWVETLVGSLADPDIARREEAAREIEAIGEPVRPVLEKAVRDGEDPEVSAGASRILLVLEARRLAEAMTTTRDAAEGRKAFLAIRELGPSVQEVLKGVCKVPSARAEDLKLSVARCERLDAGSLTAHVTLENAGKTPVWIRAGRLGAQAVSGKAAAAEPRGPEPQLELGALQNFKRIRPGDPLPEPFPDYDFIRLAPGETYRTELKVTLPRSLKWASACHVVARYGVDPVKEFEEIALGISQGGVVMQAGGALKETTPHAQSISLEASIPLTAGGEE